MGYIEEILIEARDASVLAAAHTDKAIQTTSAEEKHALMLAGIDRAEQALKMLQEARRSLVGDISRD